MSSIYYPTFDDFLREKLGFGLTRDDTDGNAHCSPSQQFPDETEDDGDAAGTQHEDWITPELNSPLLSDAFMLGLSTASFSTPAWALSGFEGDQSLGGRGISPAALERAELNAGVTAGSSRDLEPGSCADRSGFHPKAWRCPWVDCMLVALSKNEDGVKHRQENLNNMLQEWSGPTRCSWPDCASKATFKSPSTMKVHVFNLHVIPLVCTIPNCSHKKPFGKPGDLQRHITTIHERGHGFKCPVDSCDASDEGFSRKDKLQKHLREKHPLLQCPYNHCSATVLETETESHVSEHHGLFECAIGSCAVGRKSCFRDVDLQRHLRSYHRMTYDPALNLISNIEFSKDKVARGSLRSSWQDCKLCSTNKGISNER